MEGVWHPARVLLSERLPNDDHSSREREEILCHTTGRLDNEKGEVDSWDGETRQRRAEETEGGSQNPAPSKRKFINRKMPNRRRF